ncbi:MAG: hypothetical protein PHO32_09860 [Candidatus Cloacimonetes bacterium]|nr:hypothetical protein [Candidatus Cloacimonadota bacterium]
MKRISLSILCSILWGFLFSQTQSLPDINISGESEVKAFLYKRALLFSPLNAVGDSLPAFIPKGPMNMQDFTPRKTMKQRGYIQLEANSSFGVNSYISYYPRDFALHSITNSNEMRSPNSDLLYINGNLYMGMDVTKDIPLSFMADYAKASADSFSAAILHTSLAHHKAKTTMGVTEFRQLSFMAEYNHINQVNKKKQPYLRDYFNSQISGFIDSGWLDLKTKFLFQTGELGVQIAPLINSETLGINHLRPNLLIDSDFFIPTLGFLIRHPLTSGGVLYVINDPNIEKNSFLELKEKTPWVEFTDKHKLKLIPLNFKTGLEFIHPRSDDFTLSRLNIQNTVHYSLHGPQLVSGSNYGIAALHYTDLASNVCSVDALFRAGDLSLHQGAKLQLAYLPKYSYTRAAYLPAISFDTRILHSYKNFLFNLDIVQSYFTKDHLGNNLPEAVISNIGAEYREGSSSLYIQLGNILNNKLYVFSEQPVNKRNLYLGMKHRF